MTGFVVNPGTGPVADATMPLAWEAISRFAADLRARGCEVGEPQCTSPHGDRGRYRFTLDIGGVTHDIDMPGVPIDQVRFMAEPGQDVWHFPRLYVDGSSWLWCHALNVYGPQ
jgi:hypothetical protein